ncbi:MAG: hypothetical protein KAK04_12180, partial [Cyclobacteriaceae bacterium]|nr:hypothetical protein [Cyclobacteriaceae bacterium]
MNNWINSIFTGNNGIYLRNIEFFKRKIVRKKTLNKLVGINDLRIVVVSISYLLASQLAYWMIFPNTGNYPIWP